MSPFKPSRYHRKAIHKDKELICYIICYALAHIVMIYTVVKLSKEYSNTDQSSSIDTPWYPFQLLGAHGYDNTDAQWRSFTGNINILLGVMVCFLCGSGYIRFTVDRGYKVYNISSVVLSCLTREASNRDKSYGGGNNDNNNNSSTLQLLQEAVSESVLNCVSPKTAPPSAKVLPYYYTIFGVIFVTYIYGPRVIFMMVILAINYTIVRTASRILPYYGFMCVMWGFNISLLFLNQYYDGYKFSYFIPSSYGGAYLDELSSRKELMPWHVNFNMAILRMIAYCCDYREAVVDGFDLEVVNECDVNNNNKQHDGNKGSYHRVASNNTEANQTEPRRIHLKSFSYLTQNNNNNKQHDGNKGGYHRVVSISTEEILTEPRISHLKDFNYLTQNNNNNYLDIETSENTPSSTEVIENKDPNINMSFSSRHTGKAKAFSTSSSTSSTSYNSTSTFITNAQQLRDKIEKKHKTCLECLTRKGSCCYKARTDMPRHQEDYCFINYCAYLFYIPLLLAGPMSSYNGFISHIYHPQRYFKMKNVMYYGAIILILWTIITTFLHFMHLNILRSNPTVLQEGSSLIKIGFFYYSLTFLWLKFAIIWRSFRLVALIDGVETPEDLALYSYAIVSIQCFWREWHTSFNTWIVRYMYIPLGGSKRRVYNIIIIFIFIALWHDLDWSMLYWALLMSVTIIPEIMINNIVAGGRFDWLRESSYYRLLRGLASMMCCMALLGANFVGFRTSQGDVGNNNNNNNNKRGVLFTSEMTEILVIAAFIMYLHIQISWYFRDMEYEKERRMKWSFGITPHHVN